MKGGKRSSKARVCWGFSLKWKTTLLWDYRLQSLMQMTANSSRLFEIKGAANIASNLFSRRTVEPEACGHISDRFSMAEDWLWRKRARRDVSPSRVSRPSAEPAGDRPLRVEKASRHLRRVHPSFTSCKSLEPWESSLTVIWRGQTEPHLQRSCAVYLTDQHTPGRIVISVVSTGLLLWLLRITLYWQQWTVPEATKAYSYRT